MEGLIINFTKIKQMSFQYTYDSNGKAVGVFIPINEWNKITEKLLRKTPKNSKNSLLLRNIEKGMRQVKEIEEGKLKSIPLQQLLDEL